MYRMESIGWNEVIVLLMHSDGSWRESEARESTEVYIGNTVGAWPRNCCPVFQSFPLLQLVHLSPSPNAGTHGPLVVMKAELKS
jgi:hypothetical protein